MHMVCLASNMWRQGSRYPSNPTKENQPIQLYQIYAKENKPRAQAYNRPPIGPLSSPCRLLLGPPIDTPRHRSVKSEFGIFTFGSE